jgi:hypothetical protein
MNRDCLVGALVLMAASSVLAQPTATVVPNFRAYAVSADGRVVVGQNSQSRAAYWTAAGGLVPIGTPSNYNNSRAVGVSGDGAVIIGNSGSSYYSGWVWTAASGFTLMTLPGASRTTATCLSRDGQVVGGIGVVPPDVWYQSMVWTHAEGGRQMPGGNNMGTWLYALSADGSQGVGSGSSGIGTWAQHWPSTYTWCVSLGTVPGENHSYGMACTPDVGVIVGQTSTTQTGKAMIWRSGIGLELHNSIMGRPEASLRCVNDAGTLAGGFIGPGGGIAEAGLIWQAGTGLMSAESYFAAQGLTVPSLQYVVGISGDGKVIVSRTSAGSSVIVHLPPCGTADFDNDGDAGTDMDIEAFFACLAGSCCPACHGSDFNTDGDSGTDADIESFFRVLAGGAC